MKFARPQILVTCGALVVLGSLLSGSLSALTVLALVVVCLAIIHANSINDYTDREIDAVNLQDAADRPFVSGELSDKDFWLVHTLCGVAILLMSIVFGPAAVIVSAVVLALNYLYSLKPVRLTDRTLISPLVLAACYTFYPLSLGLWSNPSTAAYPWLLSTAICLAFLARILLKDFRDVEGDARFGKITFLVRYGAKATCLTSAILWTVAFGVALAALDFSLGILLTLTLGLVQVCLLLHLLWQAEDTAIQQKIITLIANAANFSILAIFLGLLAQSQDGMAPLMQAVVPIVVAGGLLVWNGIVMWVQRPQLRAKPDAITVSA